MTPAVQYVHNKSIGDLSKCKENAKLVGNFIKKKYAEGKIIGAKLKIIVDKEMLNEQYILAKTDIVTNNTFPFVYLAIQYPEQGGAEISTWLSQIDYSIVE